MTDNSNHKETAILGLGSAIHEQEVASIGHPSISLGND